MKISQSCRFNRYKKFYVQITPILPPRISPTTKLNGLENHGRGHIPLMTLGNYSKNISDKL